MIQRIQTVWLFLALISISALFLFPYVQYFDAQGIAIAIKVNGVLNSTGGQVQLHTSFLYILQSIVTIVLALLPLFAIFLFKNRKKQIQFVLLSLLIVILFAIWLFITASNAITAVNKTVGLENIGIGAILAVLYAIFLLLALNGIRKDSKLIRSADRLR